MIPCSYLGCGRGFTKYKILFPIGASLYFRLSIVVSVQCIWHVLRMSYSIQSNTTQIIPKVIQLHRLVLHFHIVWIPRNLVANLYICTCSCSASIHLDVGFEVFMQVSTKSLGIMYSLLVSPEERTNIMFVVQISDLIRAKHGSHQISLPSMHSMAICRVNTCMYVVFALLVLALADTLLYTLPVVSQAAASLLRVYRRYLQVMMTRRRVQVSDVLLRSSMDLCLAQSPVSSSDRYL